MTFESAPWSVRGRRHLPAIACAILIAVAGMPAGSAGAVTRVQGDPAVITSWNARAMSTLLADPSKQVPEVVLDVAIVQAAVYDAVVGVDGRYAPYRFRSRAPRHTSDQAAAVAAAHEALVTLSPYAQATLDTAYADSLSQIPNGSAKTKGITFGTSAADHVIRLRANDGRGAPIFFTQPPAPGVWRPTPPTFTPMLDPWLGYATPLLVHRATQFAPPTPPSLTSARYTRDFNETKTYGSKTSTVRTPDQTATALFFSGSTLVQYDTALGDQVTVRHLDIVDAARMFAAINMSAADGLITVWRAKYRYGLWRPITAINLADTDGNPATAADPSWVPLVATPAYPEYPSGYNVLIAALTGGLEDLFHTQHLDLTLTSTAVPNVTRHYDTGTALRKDVVNARVWLGFHFRFADIASRNVGLRLTDWTLEHYFQPVGQDCRPRGARN
jgi:hypothetical protein